MKQLRRALAVAAATAVIAPAALLAAPAAYATDGGTTSTTSDTPAQPSDDPATPDDTADTTPEQPSDAPADDKSPEATTPDADKDADAEQPATTPEGEEKDDKPGSGEGGTKPEDEPKPGEDEEFPEPPICESSDLELNVDGLPGKIAAGSGWHTFSLDVYNASEKSVREVHFFAGAAADEMGEKLFKTKQVELQVKNDDGWETLDLDGDAVGYVGQSDEIEAGYEIEIPMRLNVKASAPVGAGFTLGAGLYVGEDDCLGEGEVAYKFQIVKSGTDTDGTKPQEGGKVPVPDTKPANDTSPQLTGTLAETGSSDVLPVIGMVGGVAVVAGAGVVFAMRRRSGGAAA
ncbi:hypothetical protein ABZO31_20170 [Streptomyces sp. HUAS MG47]|uniref:hypothetical protein n=1 Tax=Streptomyces solicamelliae TaxID=3231716 RepID=UPI003877DAD5